MPVELRPYSCWRTVRDPLNLPECPDEHEPEWSHWYTETRAQEAVKDWAEQAEQGVLAVFQQPAPCWRLICDDCGYEADEDEYRICFPSRAEAERDARDMEWQLTTDGRVFCPGCDLPDDATLAIAPRNIPGQRTVDEVQP
jgi:hypothetical protein